MPVEMLHLPDADLAYEVTGSGPLLFLVGAPAGRAGFAELAGALAADFTVVRHDPRGIDASRRSAGAADPTPDVLADDLGALVERLGAAPADFLGASGGAVTLLALAARRPDFVRRAVLFEAPLFALVGDPDLAHRVAETLRTAEEDPERATREFFDLTAILQRTGPGEPVPAHTDLAELDAEDLERNRYFLARMALPGVFYEPDFDALESVDLVVSAGHWSHGQPARRASEELARRLGTTLVDLPGNHTAPTLEAEAFARAVVPLFS